MSEENNKPSVGQVEPKPTEIKSDKENLVEVEATDKQMSEVQELLSELPQEMLLEALTRSEANGVKVTKVEQAIQQSYSAPLPPPKMLNDYELVTSGFAERIVSMAEKEQSHRHKIEEKAVTGAINQDKRSQNYALFCIVFLALVCASLIYLDHDVAGTVLGGATLVSIAALFITGKRGNKSEEESTQEVDDSEGT